MPRRTITISVWECLRCGKQWPAKSAKKPLRCSKCKSPYWDKEKRKTRNEKD